MLLHSKVERTEGDIERRGPLPCPRPRRRGGGRGEPLTRLRGHSGGVATIYWPGVKGVTPDLPPAKGEGDGESFFQLFNGFQ